MLQLKDGKYQADMTLQIAEDLLPPDISAKVKNVVQKCRDAGDGKSGQCWTNVLNENIVFSADSVSVG
jgi:hypothetical protein